MSLRISRAIVMNLHMWLLLLVFSSLASAADSTEYGHSIDIIAKTINNDQSLEPRYYGLTYRITQFGFVLFDAAVYATKDDVNLNQAFSATPETRQSLQGYYGLRTSMLFALSRLNLQLSYLFGEAQGYERRQSGDTLGVCNCSFGVTEASVGLSLNVREQWDVGVEKSQIRMGGNKQSRHWDGKALFVRFSW